MGVVKNMRNREHHSEEQENILDRLADSVLELSDEEIVSEVREAGADPEEYAEHTRTVLLGAVQKFDEVSTRLRKVSERLRVLGHTLHLKDWQTREWGYENECRYCSLSVSVALDSGRIWGEASVRPCALGQGASGRRKASAR
jgi:hypothetical protein